MTLNLAERFTTLLRTSPETLRVLAARVDATGADAGEEQRAKSALRELVDLIADDLEGGRLLAERGFVGVLPPDDALLDASVRLEDDAAALRADARLLETNDDPDRATALQSEADRLENVQTWLDALRLGR